MIPSYQQLLFEALPRRCAPEVRRMSRAVLRSRGTSPSRPETRAVLLHARFDFCQTVFDSLKNRRGADRTPNRCGGADH
jgi:hypothetical protein